MPRADNSIITGHYVSSNEALQIKVNEEERRFWHYGPDEYLLFPSINASVISALTFEVASYLLIIIYFIILKLTWYVQYLFLITAPHSHGALIGHAGRRTASISTVLASKH